MTLPSCWICRKSLRAYRWASEVKDARDRTRKRRAISRDRKLLASHFLRGYCKISVTGVECDRDPLVPVIVSVDGPVFVPREVLIVKVEMVPETDAELKAAEEPLGSPVTFKFTVPLNPFCRVSVTV